ncbi:MAG: DUF2254 domain-containing protein [Nitrospirales bacterium]
MKTRLLNYWLMLRSSLWFIPTLMTLSAIALALLTIVVDRSVDLPHVMGEGFLYTLGPSGARTLLATVAGSVITIAGVVFSITIVALTLASSHFGPRLLKNFMKDMGNQVVLGTFIATFLYCLLVLGAIRENGANIFVPHISVLVGLLLTLASMGVFIFFIHHISVSIHADTVVAGVSRELKAAINHLFPEKMGQSPPAPDPPLDEVLPAGFQDDSISFVSRGSGYLQAIDSPGVMALANREDVLIQFLYRPGEFIVEGETIGKVWPPGRVTEAMIGDLQQSFLLGSQRTEEQDIEFSIHQLVEVALRALSPGINDPFTAISCIDRLGDALTLLSGRILPSSRRYNEEHILRVITYPLTIDGIFDAAFNQLRQYGCGSVAVGIRLLEVFSIIAQNTDNSQVHQAIRRHATMVKEAMVKHISELFDRREVEERYDLVLHYVSQAKNAL